MQDMVGERPRTSGAVQSEADAGGMPGKQTLKGAEVGAHDHPAEGEADKVAHQVVEKLHGGDDRKATGGADWSSQRARFEAAFGADFSAVRVHIGGESEDHAHAMNAAAYAQGSEVHFRAGQFAPGSRDGDFLIAHELAHVVQQGSAPASGATVRRQIFDGIVERGGTAVRRKITIGGKPYKPGKSVLGKLSAVGKEHVTVMDASATTFDFADEATLVRDATTRQNIVKGMDTANSNGSCRYYGYGEDAWLDPAFFDKAGNFSFTVKAGVKPSAAVARIFQPQTDANDKLRSKLECLSMTTAIEYKAQLDTLGAAQFDKQYPNGSGITISNQGGIQKDALAYAGGAYTGVKDLQPGDWVYFKNHPDYLKKHPVGYWQGENAIYMGRDGGKATGERIFGGFGVKNEKESELKTDLMNQFNAAPGPEDKASPSYDKSWDAKTITIDEVPGVLADPVLRPGANATKLK
ncbi:MAG TPA: DUF4157 domain-containing protein [Kofleriaceae bacterium]|jgi:hypothetical protein